MYLARRRRWRRAPGRLLFPPVSRVAQSEAESSSQRSKRRRSRAAKDQSRKQKRADKNREEESNATSRTEKRDTGDQEAAAAASASGAAEPGCSSDASSAVSSPLRWPYRPTIFKAPGVEIVETCDPAIEAAYRVLKVKYHEKRDKQFEPSFSSCVPSRTPTIDHHLKLPTLDQHVPHSCLVKPNLLPVRDAASKTVLQAAKAVLGLSSYVDGKLLNRSSGFPMNWDDGGKDCTILTSALLIRSKSSLDEWSGTDEYATDAEVRVHLLDKEDTTVAARLVHYDKHFNLALFKVDMNVSLQIPCYSSEVMCGQEVFVLGRDSGLYLKIGHGNIQYKGANSFHRHHYMFISCLIDQCVIGGPVIDFHGRVLGMVSFSGMGFVP